MPEPLTPEEETAHIQWIRDRLSADVIEEYEALIAEFYRLKEENETLSRENRLERLRRKP